MLSKRVAHLSGDVMEADGSLVPRRRAFSLSFGMSGGTSRSVVAHESPLVLKSSSVSSVTSKPVEDFVRCDDTWDLVTGELMCIPVVTVSFLVRVTHAQL